MGLSLFAFLIVAIVHIVTIREGIFSFFCEQCGEGWCCMGVISKKKKRYECDQEFVWGGGDGGAAACAMDMWGVGEVVHGGDSLCGPLGER